MEPRQPAIRYYTRGECSNRPFDRGLVFSSGDTKSGIYEREKSSSRLAEGSLDSFVQL